MDPISKACKIFSINALPLGVLGETFLGVLYGKPFDNGVLYMDWDKPRNQLSIDAPFPLSHRIPIHHMLKPTYQLGNKSNKAHFDIGPEMRKY